MYKSFSCWIQLDWVALLIGVMVYLVAYFRYKAELTILNNSVLP